MNGLLRIVYEWAGCREKFSPLSCQPVKTAKITTDKVTTDEVTADKVAIDKVTTDKVTNIAADIPWTMVLGGTVQYM